MELVWGGDVTNSATLCSVDMEFICRIPLCLTPLIFYFVYKSFPVIRLHYKQLMSPNLLLISTKTVVFPFNLPHQGICCISAKYWYVFGQSSFATEVLVLHQVNFKAVHLAANIKECITNYILNGST